MGTSKAISGKAAGNWSYRGRACNAGGCGPWSGTATVNVIYPPAGAPAVTVPATNTSGGYSVSWTTVSGASSYQLQERLNSGSWSTIHNAGGTSKAVSGKSTGTWNYRGRACNDAGCGGWSTTRSTAVTRPPTSAPTLTAPATNTSGAYTVSWTAVTHATKYQLQERLGTGSWSTVHDAAGSSKAISGKATGAWSYRARACNAAGCGGWSAQRSVEVTRAPTGSPTVTATTPTGTGAFTVSWRAVSDAATYDLQERTGSGSWARIQQGTARSRTITGKGPGTYQYRARGCNGAGCGPYSSAVSVALSLPATPTGLSVNGGDFFCEIGWSASTGATRYELQRGGLEIYRGAQSSAYLTSGCVASQAHQVRACNGVGCSAWSATVFWTPPGGGGPIHSIPETGGDE